MHTNILRYLYMYMKGFYRHIPNSCSDNVLNEVTGAFCFMLLIYLEKNTIVCYKLEEDFETT